MPTRWVVFYTPAPDVLERAPAVMPAHDAHYEDFVARGLMTGIGTFEDPGVNGAMSVLVSREAAEQFASRDPFVTEGLVTAYRILAWNDVVG